MAEIGSVIAGKYKILDQVGKGGMSTVYLAQDSNLRKNWAIKEVQKKTEDKNGDIIINSLLTEAEMMKGLSYPSFPTIVDIIENDESIYIVMDYIAGESLDKKIKREGAQKKEDVLAWAKQLCEALFYLHTQDPPIIYRDMKPSNIMWLEDKYKKEGYLKIIDFGIAREYVRPDDTIILGTNGYAPPEQHRGRTDERSDIFALGVTLHYLLTGIDPQKQNVFIAESGWHPELYGGLGLIISQCVELLPEHRYQNCSALLWALNHESELTGDFITIQKRKVVAFALALSLSTLSLASGVICSQAATNINNKDYDNLIGISQSSSLEEKAASYKEAIEIYPDRLDSYNLLLDAYIQEEHFSKAENDELLALYNKYKNEFDMTSASVAELNYRIGTMYFNYYTEEDGSVNFQSRIQKAYSFFALNFEEEAASPELATQFSNKRLSDCYYQICTFYKKYILMSSTVEEASKDNYEELFETINSCLSEVQNAGPYDQLSLYHATFMLMYDQRESMMQVNVEQDDIISMMNIVYEKAKDLVVNKDQSKILRQRIIDNYESYKKAVETVYENAQKRE